MADQVQSVLTKFLAGGETGVQYLGDVVEFLFVLNVVRGVVKNGKHTLVGVFGYSFLRAFGDVNIAVAIGTGKAPAANFGNLDHCLHVIFAAYFWTRFVEAQIPAQIRRYVAHVENLCFAVVKSANAVAGYNALSASGEFVGLFGAYAGAQGARLVESGISATLSKKDSVALLATVAGLFLTIFARFVQTSADNTGALLALWFFSCNFVDYRSKFDFTSVTSKATAAMKSMKRKSK